MPKNQGESNQGRDDSLSQARCSTLIVREYLSWLSRTLLRLLEIDGVLTCGLFAFASVRYRRRFAGQIAQILHHTSFISSDAIIAFKCSFDDPGPNYDHQVCTVSVFLPVVK